jgi:hypothetical protein
MELYGPTDYDVLDVAGNLSAGGTLDVKLAVNAAPPTAGDMFDVLDFASLSGAFATLILPGLSAGLAWDTSSLYTDGRLAVVAGLAGDYNGDGTVDAADYTLWRDNLGGDASALAAGSRDPANFGPVSVEDYAFWTNNLGNSNGGAAAAVAVPEPMTILSACCLWLALGLGRMRRTCLAGDSITASR